MYYNLAVRYETQDDCVQGREYAQKPERSTHKSCIDLRCSDAFIHTSKSGYTVSGSTQLSGPNADIRASFFSAQENMTIDIFQAKGSGGTLSLQNIKIRHCDLGDTELPLLHLTIRIFKPSPIYYTQQQDQQSGAVDVGSLQEETTIPIHHYANELYFVP